MYRQVRKEDLGEEIKDFDLYPNTMGEGNEKIQAGRDIISLVLSEDHSGYVVEDRMNVQKPI